MRRRRGEGGRGGARREEQRGRRRREEEEGHISEVAGTPLTFSVFAQGSLESDAKVEIKNEKTKGKMSQ